MLNSVDLVPNVFVGNSSAYGIVKRSLRVVILKQSLGTRYYADFALSNGCDSVFVARLIAAVDRSEMLKKRVLEAGFYVARIQDETFSLESPSGFQAKCF